MKKVPTVLSAAGFKRVRGGDEVALKLVATDGTEIETRYPASKFAEVGNMAKVVRDIVTSAYAAGQQQARRVMTASNDAVRSDNTRTGRLLDDERRKLRAIKAMIGDVGYVRDDED